MVRLSLFLALPELRGTRRILSVAWGVIGYRLWNDLDFEFLTWHPHAVTGLERLRECLADGRGVIACSQHLGAYRRVYYELVRRGFNVTLVADERVAGTLVQSTCAQLLRQGASAEELSGFKAGFSVLDATQPGMVRRILEALDRNCVVLVYLDGNTGARLPGTGGSDSTVVELFGQKLAIRHGACRIAYLRQVSIVPVFARWKAGRASLACLPPITPDQALPVAEFCRRTLQTLFQLTEDEIRRDPIQFEHWMYLHRWRAESPENATPGEEAIEEARRQILAGGEEARYRVDREKLLLVRIGEGRVLADPARGRFLKVGRLLADLVSTLRRRLSLREINLRLGRRYASAQLLEALARIKVLGLLVEEGPEICS